MNIPGNLFIRNFIFAGYLLFRYVLLGFLNVQPSFSQTSAPVVFQSFDFGEIRRPLSHEVFVPISGNPIIGISHTAVATLTESFDTAAFRLVSLTGGVIQTIKLAMPFDDGNRTRFEEFTGSFIPPNQPFQVAVSGLDASGASCDILIPKIFTT